MFIVLLYKINYKKLILLFEPFLARGSSSADTRGTAAPLTS